MPQAFLTLWFLTRWPSTFKTDLGHGEPSRLTTAARFHNPSENFLRRFWERWGTGLGGWPCFDESFGKVPDGPIHLFILRRRWGERGLVVPRRQDYHVDLLAHPFKWTQPPMYINEIQWSNPINHHTRVSSSNSTSPKKETSPQAHFYCLQIKPNSKNHKPKSVPTYPSQAPSTQIRPQPQVCAEILVEGRWYCRGLVLSAGAPRGSDTDGGAGGGVGEIGCVVTGCISQGCEMGGAILECQFSQGSQGGTRWIQREVCPAVIRILTQPGHVASE